MSLTIILKAIELGLIFSILSLGVYISFRVLNVPDLTVDGSFATGCAVCAVMTIAGHPYLGLLLAFVVLKTGSILSSMIIHFCANALTVIFYNFNIFNGEITINFVYWLIAIAILVVFGFLVFYLGKVLQNKDKSLNAKQLLDEINKINSFKFKNDEKVSKEEELLKLFEEIQELKK